MTGNFQPAAQNFNRIRETRLVVKGKGAGVRLDSFCSRYFNDYSRTEIQREIKDGRITVNDSRKKSSFMLSYGDTVTCKLPEKISNTTIPWDFSLSVLYEDDYFLVVNKPPGIPIHPVAGNLNQTLVNAAVYYLGSLGKKPYPVHRLDWPVSGIVLMAKTKESARAASEMFAQRDIKKRYVALVEGRPKKSSGTLSQLWPGKQGGDDRSVKKTETRFRVLRFYADTSFVLFVPVTGRKHQIRRHARELGCPILGDVRYGAQSQGQTRIALHAAQIQFRHPFTGAAFSQTARVPPDFWM